MFCTLSIEDEILLGLLPSEVGISLSEVSETRCFQINGALELKFLHDFARSEREILLDDAGQILLRDVPYA